ncbi:hypothetical protein LAZ67_5002542, partial [Cordylochernes scorpioides]
MGKNHLKKYVNLHVKMPKLELPTFNGRLESWLSFKDLFFSAMVLTHKYLILKSYNIERPTEWRSPKTGQRISNYSDNYAEVWQTLLSRYDNPKDLIFTQIDNALRLPKLADDNHNSMFKLLDSCNEIVRTVKVLGYQINSLSEVFFVKIIQDKLDKTTRKQWELQNNPRVVPSIEDLMGFSEIHAKEFFSKGSRRSIRNIIQSHHACLETQNIVEKFLKLESIPDVTSISKDENESEIHLVETHGRDSTGRYVVQLPFRNDCQLGDSRSNAIKRLCSLERTLIPRPGVYDQYRSFIKEYLELGHMSLVPKEDIIKGRYYLPHHPVIKEKCCTTKLRVVFDASAKTDSGLSLNDALIPGPKIQQDLFHIILRFRIHPVAINADIAKMYRQIRISQEDSEFQRIVWRNDPHDKIKNYRLETVTYGTSCAPFLATRITKQLALDEQSKFPKDSKIALTDFYVDDLVTGTCSVDEGKNLVQEPYGLLSAGGFELRKWTSNVPDVLSLLPNHLKSTNTNIGFEESKEFVNVLGLQWQPRTDGFTFKGIALPLNSMTKRGILSQVAKIFDPLGWISPFTTTIKLILQELWKTGLEWDDPIPEELRRKLTLINQDLPSLEHIQIPRCVVPGNFMKVEFHGFCDASQKAYAASLYLKVILSNTSAKTFLLVAKTRVAPMKVVSLPKLELCSALLLTRLVKTVYENLPLTINEIYLWSDSTIALCWINSEPCRWKTFVANRVAEIHRLVSGVWCHVDGRQNPADCASRGIFPSDLVKHPLWNVGATRVTSARVDRRILRQAVAAPQATCTAILQHVQDTLDHSISTRTISRRLVANGLHSCRPLRRLPLTPPNRRQRLEWCRARSTWMTEWHRVVFSDESRFCLSIDSRRVRVWRRRGERSNPAAIVERPTVRQRGIMFWGAIAYDSRSPLLRIQGTMTAQRYVDDVLRPVTLPYLQGVPNALYQQDNARPHTARISQQALQDVQMLPWPPHSPDLSPIEHVWDIIGRRLHALPQPRSEDELWQMVEREWRAFPQDAIRTLIDSLPRRVAACIAVREYRQSWSRQSGKLGNVHTKEEDTVALRKFREQIKVELGAKDGELEEFSLVYMVDGEDLGDNRRGLPLMPNETILLSTAIVRVRAENGSFHPCRALIDTGSQRSLITENCREKLNLPVKKSQLTVFGIGNQPIQQSASETFLQFKPHFSDRIFKISSIILHQITVDLPNFLINRDNWPHLKNTLLADPNFDKTSPIDLVIGADLAPFLYTGKLRFQNHPGPTACSSKLGWILSGNVSSSETGNNYITLCSTSQGDDNLRQFFELESVPAALPLTKEEKSSGDIYDKNFCISTDGRYSVGLPFKSVPNLGEARHNAMKRFLALERKLHKSSNLLQQYKDFMMEYLSLNHMELIPKNERDKPSDKCYYIPHHCVLREQSSTKLRVVFDASCKTSNNYSLNEFLHTGPKLQHDIFNILVKFRTNPIAFTGDIEKMYRQIKVNSSDLDFQRIFWRNSPLESLLEYRLLTVTYGMSCAPYLAITTYFLAQQQSKKQRFSLMISGKSFFSGGFCIRKWMSNVPEVLSEVPEALKAHYSYEIGDNSSVKILGINWNPFTDNFTITVNSLKDVYSKRQLLSDISRIYDPLGWLSPVIISFNILFQTLWKQDLDWDDPFSESLCSHWRRVQMDLAMLNHIEIPRYISCKGLIHSLEIHGFCDASESAYSSVVYMKSRFKSGHVQVTLIAAKTKVAPLKATSIPRLELCAALLLSNLYDSICSSLLLQIDRPILWTDSQIVLSWIKSESKHWKPFVGNRIAEIQRLTLQSSWYYVSTKDNPADCASRGITSSELVNHSLWWNGPDWLSNSSLQDPLPITYELPKEGQRCFLAKMVQGISKQSATTVQMEKTLFQPEGWRFGVGKRLSYAFNAVEPLPHHQGVTWSGWHGPSCGTSNRETTSSNKTHLEDWTSAILILLKKKLSTLCDPFLLPCVWTTSTGG